MERKTAEEIVALANSCIDKLLSSLEAVQKVVSAEEFAAYKRGIAKVLNAIDVEIIERVARDFPDLRTDDDSDHAGVPDLPKSSHN
ncbi:MAG: hypothetical protein H7Y89_00105 [Steroidobacteraceae bacterium]|nr:hypothetical protein [Steroidobacteraceae bacterium]